MRHKRRGIEFWEGTPALVYIFLNVFTKARVDIEPGDIFGREKAKAIILDLFYSSVSKSECRRVRENSSFKKA